MTSKLKVDEIAPRTVDRITGIKLYDVSQWRVTTDFTGDATPIATNLEEVDAPVGFGKLGSSMSESSGIFSFPAVGMWWVEFTVYATNANYMEQVLYISTTTNNSTYATAAYGAQIKAQSAGSGVANISTLFDVTDTAQCKCKFNVTQEGATVTTRGDTAVNETYMTFMRLGDST